MDLIRWASLISDVEEEAADTICMWFFSLVVATPSRVESGWHDGTVGPTYLSDVRGFRAKCKNARCAENHQVTRTASSATQSRKFLHVPGRGKGMPYQQSSLPEEQVAGSDMIALSSGIPKTGDWYIATLVSISISLQHAWYL